MSDPQPGHVITVFRSRLNPGVEADYAVVAAEMFGIASSMPGFVSIEDFTSDDGERLAIVVFESTEAQQAWRAHPRHLEVQELARERFYAEYSVAICECVRAHRWCR